MGWSFLPGDIVRRILSFLRDSGRFRLDGPAVRATNRHWRDCVNQDIVFISPEEHHCLVSADVASLRRFICLVSLDIRPFTCHKKWGRRGNEAAAVLASVSKTKTLSRICLDALDISTSSMKCLSEMKNVKELDVCSGKVTSSKLALLISLRLDELRLQEPVSQNDSFTKVTTSVKKLDVSVGHVTKDLAETLEGLDEVTIRTESDDFEWISEIENLVALHCTSRVLTSMSDVSHLSKLKALTVTASAEMLLNKNAWDCIFRQLTCLKLRGQLLFERLRTDFFEEATSLENLSLHSFNIQNATLQTAGLHNLKSLSLIRYVLEEDFTFLGFLTQLKSLYCRGYKKWTYDSAPFKSSIRKLTQLKDFEFCCRSTTMFLDFKELCTEKAFVGLEKLKIHGAIEVMCQQNCNIYRFIDMTQLPRLATLILTGTAAITQISPLLEGFPRELMTGTNLRSVVAQIAMSHRDKKRADILYKHVKQNVLITEIQNKSMESTRDLSHH